MWQRMATVLVMYAQKIMLQWYVLRHVISVSLIDMIEEMIGILTKNRLKKLKQVLFIEKDTKPQKYTQWFFFHLKRQHFTSYR